MKIWGEIPKISEVYGKRKNVSQIGKMGEVTSKNDVISISKQAKDFQTSINALKDIPDIRAEKIFELERLYQSGRYDVKGKDIADKIVRNILDKKV